MTIGGLAAPVTSSTNTTLVVTVPAHAAGVVDVVVTLSGQTATLTGGFTYGTVTSLPSPSQGGTATGPVNPLPGSRQGGTNLGVPSPLPAPHP